jgi:hypothetical protein
MKGSLVWLPLCCIRCHQTDLLLLHFHATSVMMPHASPTIAPLPVLWQKSETLARLASRRSNPSDVDACPDTIFICSSVLRHKPINLLPLGFEAQTKKQSKWFWGQTTDKPSPPILRLNQKNPCFSSPSRVWCRSHTSSPDLSIIRPPSTQLLPNQPRSSVPSLLLLSRSSSLRHVAFATYTSWDK